MVSLVRALFSWRNPTRSWIADRARPLVLDLDAHCFNGVAIGDSLQRLSFLGIATPRLGMLRYPDDGIALAADDGCLAELQIFFGHPAESRAGKFAGELRFRGERLPLSCASNEQQLTAHFGEPYWHDADLGETILFYELGPVEWQVELGSDGRLKCFVLSRPLLADPAQRASYGVNKPWPPR